MKRLAASLLCALVVPSCVSFYDVGTPVFEATDATGSDSFGVNPDASDAGLDASFDAGTDAATDAGAGADAIADAGVDADAPDVRDTDGGGALDTTEPDITPAVDEGWSYIGPGEFTMGSPVGEPGRSVDEVQHSVVLTRAFEVMQNEVTNNDWARVFDEDVEGCGVCPVTSRTWFGALAYANALSREAELEQCYDLRRCDAEPGEGDPLSCNKNVRFTGLDCAGYRLPTEAEWEYAARAGREGRYPNDGELSSFAMCRAGAVTQVGTRPPNAWGLHDTLGNADEWVFSTYAAYPSDSVTDPVSQSNGELPVKRGGGYDSSGSCRIADRESAARDFSDPSLGFRLVRTLGVRDDGEVDDD